MQLTFEDARRRRGLALTVLPDAARVEERLAEKARAQGLVAFKAACSFAELERELVREARRAGKCPATAPPEAVLLALREASDGPFQAGTVRALRELLALDPAELTGSERAVALGRTLGAARAILERAGLCEPERAVRLAVEALEKGLPLPSRLFARAAEVEFDAVLDWTPQRLRLAKALAARMPVRIRLPWCAGRPELTDPLEPTLRALESMSGADVELFDPEQGSLAPFLRRLFAEDRSPGDAPVEMISCANLTAQAREVARACADLLAAGAAPDSIAVAVRNIERAGELAAALHRYGVPWRERRGRAALTAPPIRLALHLLQLVEQEFPREALIEALSSRLLWLREESDRFPPHELARVLRKAHVRDGGDLAASLEVLAGRSKDPAVQETSRRSARFVAALRELPARATLREHGTALLQLLDRWRLRDAVLRDACVSLARASALLGERPYLRAEWAQLLAASLHDVSLRPPGARGGEVQLLELRELPGRSFDHVLVAGLVDGELPARPAAHPLLPDERARPSEEPLLFHLALCAARTSLALFWPRADDRGRELVSSPFADEAARALGREPRRAPLAPIPAAADCRSATELLARAALDAFAEPAFRASPEGEGRALAAALAGSSFAPRLARVERAALAERERVRAFIKEIEPGRFSGQLSGAALEKALPAFRFGPDAPVSARQLENHATCSFRTLARRLLRLQSDDEDDEELGRRKEGVLLHRCLERYFRRMREEERLPLRGAPEELRVLREVAEAEMADFAAQEHVGHAALWELQREELLRKLAAVVEADTGSQPLELERKFGYPDSWPALRLTSGSEEIHVRGIIDRIDRAPGGTLLVLDYKSGRPETLRRKLRARTLLAPEFQLSLYAAAVRQREPAARVDAAYLSLRTGEQTSTLRKAAARDGVDVDALLGDELPRVVFARVGEMRRGFFEVRPLSCDFCDLKPACRLVALPTDPEENGGG
jgi:RecB family exonuclease